VRSAFAILASASTDGRKRPCSNRLTAERDSPDRMPRAASDRAAAVRAARTRAASTRTTGSAWSTARFRAARAVAFATTMWRRSAASSACRARAHARVQVFALEPRGLMLAASRFACASSTVQPHSEHRQPGGRGYLYVEPFPYRARRWWRSRWRAQAGVQTTAWPRSRPRPRRARRLSAVAPSMPHSAHRQLDPRSAPDTATPEVYRTAADVAQDGAACPWAASRRPLWHAPGVEALAVTDQLRPHLAALAECAHPVRVLARRAPSQRRRRRLYRLARR
jgi:hypothetical protein